MARGSCGGRHPKQRTPVADTGTLALHPASPPHCNEHGPSDYRGWIPPRWCTRGETQWAL